MSSEKITDLVKQSLVESCKNGYIEILQKWLNLVYEKMVYAQDQKEVDDIFCQMFIVASDNPDVLRVLFEFYRKINEGITPTNFTYPFLLPYEKYLFDDEDIEITLSNIMDFLRSDQNFEYSQRDNLEDIEIEAENQNDKYPLKDVNPMEIIEEIIMMNDPKSPIFLHRLFSILDIENFTREMLIPLCEKAWSLPSENTFSTLFQFLVKISPYAPIPTWVRNFVYNPEEFPIENSWYVQNRDKYQLNDKIVKESLEKSVPFWVAENHFSYDYDPLVDEDDDNFEEQTKTNQETLYLCIEQQNTELGHTILEDEYAEFDTKGQQLPFEEDLALPEYPEPYHAGDVLEVLPQFWEDTWHTLERDITQKNVDDEEVKVDMEYEEERQHLRYRALTMPLYTWNTLFGKYLPKVSMDDIRTDVSYFRVYGPRNCIPEDEQYDGGERMFISNIFDGGIDEDDDEADDYDEWFKGYCEQCGLKIRRKNHAIRKPKLGGGWIGCYCSPECIASTIEEHDIYTIRLLQAIIDDLLTIGIQDFIEKEEGEDEENGLEFEDEEEKKMNDLKEKLGILA